MAYTIDDLNALVQAASGDELPIWDVSATGNEEPTKKITLQNLAAAIKTLASLLGTGDVVNNLTSTATDKPLSAAQGKALNDNLANFINVATKSFSGLSVSSAGGYTKIADYSDLGVALQNIISIADQSRNFSGSISFQLDLGGLYMYCSSSFSNGSMIIRYVYK